jgi:WD40 repeat protein
MVRSFSMDCRPSTMDFKNYKNQSMRLTLIICSALLLLFSASYAQNSQDQFGKSRIQYKNLRWQYISTINFNIYYSEGGKELAGNVARYAESDFARIAETLGFSPDSKILIIVYNSVSELRQSNLALEDLNLVGGQTNFVKSKLEIAFEGSQSKIKKDISYGIADIMINTLMYGGSLREVVQSSYKISLYDWFINGAAAYVAEDWSVEMDNLMRDAFLNRHLHKPDAFTGSQATLAGQSVWNYIVQKYGSKNFASVLNMSQNYKNEESGIESSFGIPYHIFTKEWREYYTGMAQQAQLSYKMPLKELMLVKNNSKDYDYQNLCFSRNGKYLSYSRNHKGKYAVMLTDLDKHKTRKIFRGGYKVVNQKIDMKRPLTDWQNETVFSILDRHHDKIYLRVYDLERKTKKKILLKNIKEIFSYDLSEDGNTMVMSASEKGQSDIYIYELKTNTIKRLTDDLFDDIDPRFIGNAGIAFCSNRKENVPTKEAEFKDITPYYHIYTMDPDGRDMKIITQHGINTSPRANDNNTLSYLSTENGIATLFSYDLTAHHKTQLTSYALDIDEYDITPERNKIAFTMLHKGKERIFYNPLFVPESFVGTSLTARQQKIVDANPSLAIDLDNRPVEDTANNGDIDINNYHFEPEIRKPQLNKAGDKSIKQKAKDDINVKGPYSYKNLFSADRLTSTLLVDPLKGLGLLGEISMADMFANHRITAGIFAVLDLKSSNLYSEYSYLKKRVDVKSRFDRESYYATNASATQRYTLNRFTTGIAIPLSATDRISIFPMIVTTRFTDYDTLLPLYDKSNVYGGIRAEYVFDNTIAHGMNLINGTRAKITFEKLDDPKNKEKNFGKYTFDIRHYQKLHRELCFATRISFGGFFGNAKKNFLLGGMDNWLLKTSSNTGHNQPLAVEKHYDNSDLLFVRYITNLRGFNYNTQYGSRFFIFNAELRFPIIKYFHQGTIRSNFFRNLQFVGFTDAGSAWSGISPFKKANSTNTQVINSPPFTATVVNYINPFLIGYGLGMRTFLLGYFMKLDIGWGLVNNQVQKPKAYVTFGYDF